MTKYPDTRDGFLDKAFEIWKVGKSWTDLQSLLYQLLDHVEAETEKRVREEMNNDTRVHNKSNMFWLERTEDISGVSGVGVVADGIIFPDGTAVLRWRTAGGSTAVYDSIEDLERIHGHDGRTKIIYPYRLTQPKENI